VRWHYITYVAITAGVAAARRTATNPGSADLLDLHGRHLGRRGGAGNFTTGSRPRPDAAVSITTDPPAMGAIVLLDWKAEAAAPCPLVCCNCAWYSACKARRSAPPLAMVGFEGEVPRDRGCVQTMARFVPLERQACGLDEEKPDASQSITVVRPRGSHPSRARGVIGPTIRPRGRSCSVELRRWDDYRASFARRPVPSRRASASASSRP
jgi:hypothetical protein